MLSYACYNILMIEFIELIKVFLLSVIQGITEWLPVSSTGHMILLDDILKLQDKMVPLQSTYTQTGSSDTGGAPTKDLGDLTDDGEASIDKRDKAN